MADLPKSGGKAEEIDETGSIRLSSATRKAVGRLSAARVVDMRAFLDAKAKGDGARKIASRLATTLATAQKLMAGVHWQQQPAKVAQYNAARGAHISEMDGMPTADDLARFGGVYEKVTRHSSPQDKDLSDLIRLSGAPPNAVAEVKRKLKALGGGEIELPEKIDTKWLQDEVTKKFGMVLAMFDMTTIASMAPRDMIAAMNGLNNIRQLLRGEPTGIIRNEDRGPLNDLTKMLIAEAKRRGLQSEPLVIEGETTEIVH